MLLACTVGCTGREPPLAAHDGFLRLGGDKGTLCIQSTPSREYTYAWDGVTNDTNGPIRIDRISLVGADNASMVQGYLAPIHDNSLIGAMPGWPPIGHGLTPAFEAKKQVPATVGSRERANLVIHVKAEAPATIDAVEVTYVYQGKTLRVRNSTTLYIRSACT